MVGGVCESCDRIPATAFVFFEEPDDDGAGFFVCDDCIPVEITTAVVYG